MPRLNNQGPPITQPPFFSNWADLFMPKIANIMLSFFAAIPGLTPNIVTSASFIIYLLGCLLLFTNFEQKLLLTAILLPTAYILDCLDGQLARLKKIHSAFGNYFDCVLDFLKIFILLFTVSYYVYLNTGDIIFILLGFIACFFFTYRFYIKYITMYTQLDKDPLYLEKSKQTRNQLFQMINEEHVRLKRTVIGTIRVFLKNNSTIFLIDEAELVIFTSIAALFNRLDLALWIFAIGNIANAFFRVIQRGYQILYQGQELLKPIRK